MKRIVLLLTAIALTIHPLIAAEKATLGFVREQGKVGLGKNGSQLEIVPSTKGHFSWSLTWLRQSVPVTISKKEYFKSKGWFAFVESPSRVWLYNGIEELTLAEEAKDGISQRSALYKPVLESCPPEVLKALPKDFRDKLHKNSKD